LPQVLFETTWRAQDQDHLDGSITLLVFLPTGALAWTWLARWTWLDPCGSGLGTCSRLLASIVWTDVERFRVRHSRFRSSAREGTTRNCTPTYEAQLGVTGKSPHPRYAVSIEAPFRSPIPLSLLSIHFSTSPNPLWRWCLLHARRVAATTCGRHQRLFPHVRATLGLRLEICKRNL
jgi:hypothetical protein